jgi:hypothetical protein
MKCKYSINGSGKYPICAINNQMCPMIRFCGEENSFIQIENCNLACNIFLKEEDKINQKDGANKVRFELEGYLYVEMNDANNQVKKFLNPFKSTPKYVDIIVVDGVEYIKGTEPEKSKKQKGNTRRK